MDEFAFNRCIKVIGHGPGWPDQRKAVIIEQQHLKEHGGHTYFHVGAKQFHCMSLFTGVTSKNDTRPMSKTDIVNEITTRRNETIDGIIDKAKSKLGVGGAASTFDFLAKATISNYQYRAVRLTLQRPDAIDVACPTIGQGGAPYQMKVLGTCRKNDPLYVELTSKNIEYFREWCEYQIRDGAIKRKRSLKKESKSKPKERSRQKRSRPTKKDDVEEDVDVQGLETDVEEADHIEEAGLETDVEEADHIEEAGLEADVEEALPTSATTSTSEQCGESRRRRTLRHYFAQRP